MRAEIIVIGDEILIGQTVDTNSAFIGSELSKLGFDVYRKVAIHDNKTDILEALAAAAGKADVVMITGGLGPTSDDITKPVLCEFFNTELGLNQEVLAMIEEMMRKRGWQMNENNRKQAEVPLTCTILRNAVGTAPGMRFEKDGTFFFSMPGVPNEMKYLMTTHILPWLKQKFRTQAIIHKSIMTYGLGEALLAEKLTDFEAQLPVEIKLAYLPSLGMIKLRLTATGKDRKYLETIISDQVKKLYLIIPELIFAEDEETFEIVIGRLLRKRHQTIATAESCTGGRIAQMITSIPGSSAYFKGSVIAYDNAVKTMLLGVPEEELESHGAVSREVVERMAEGVRKLLNTDFSIATTGIAGPDGGSEQKPVGTVWIAVSSSSGTVSEKYIYGNDRNTTISRFAVAALNLARRQIIRQ